MRSEAYKLFVDGDLVRKNCAFRDESCFVYGNVADELLDASFDFGILIFYVRFGEGRDLRRQIHDAALLCFDIRFHVCALAFSGGNECGGCFFQYGKQIIPFSLHVFVGLLDGEDIAVCGNCHGCDIVCQTEFFGEAAECRDVACCVSGIQFYADTDFFQNINGNVNLKLTAGNSLGREVGFDLVLQKAEDLRNLDGAIEITIVDGFDFYKDISAADLSFGAAVSCHTFNHKRSFLSLRLRVKIYFQPIFVRIQFLYYNILYLIFTPLVN